MKFNVLIVDDERLVCSSMKRILENEDRNIFTAENGKKAKDVLNDQSIDLLLLDYKLQNENGIQLLKEIKEDYPELTVIMITAYGNIEIAVEAMKSGAYDFIQKKAEPQFLTYTVKRALDNLRLRKEVQELRRSYRNKKKLPEIIAQSPFMKSAVELAEEYAKSDSTVLISGETGTGKTLIAEYIHSQSYRFNQPFVSINCSAIPSELIESELFGYESGAFTGARSQGKKGLLEQAAGGTLFLDEIGELSLDLQSKLLHVFEKNEFLRLGAVEPRQVNVRFIAASNSDLNEKVEQKTFRMDLYYRLNVANIAIPALRKRKEDIVPLTKLFVEYFNTKMNKSVRKIEEDVYNFLKASYWQGNVRELRNYIERAMLLKRDGTLRLKDFIDRTIPRLQRNGETNIQVHVDHAKKVNLLHEIQKQLILHALEITGNNVTQAARFLGIPRTSLSSCLDRFGIRDKKE